MSGIEMGGSAESEDVRDKSSRSDSEESASVTTVISARASMDSATTNDDKVEPESVPTMKESIAPEYSVPTRTKYLYLAFYFSLNLTLTLYNKSVLGQFSFPWLLTTLHTGSASLGCYILLLRGQFSLSRLNFREYLVMIAFSFLFTINIAISNVSLSMVSVPFHQIMRSTTPIFTIIFYQLIYSRTYSRATYLSLIPVIAGVGLSTYGDYEFTIAGFFLTLLGVVLASAKTVASNRLMTGSLALPALEILLRMSPLAAIQSLLYAMATGEGSRFRSWVLEGHLTPVYGMALAGNGVLAFLLNVSSFNTNKLAGALTITVCANMKQCLTVLLGIAMFNVRVGLLNGLGMLIALVGAGIYSKVELDSKGRKEDIIVEVQEPLMRDVERCEEKGYMVPKAS